VHQIPEAKWSEVGTALVNVCGISREEELVDLIPVGDFSPPAAVEGGAVDGAEHPPGNYLLFITREGLTKLTPVSEFQSNRTSGIAAFKVPEGDALARVIPTDGRGEAILLTRYGQGIRFDLSEVAVQGRAAKGVQGMKVDHGDRVEDALLVPHDTWANIAVFTRSGRAKLSPLEELPKQRRGGKGVRMIVLRIQSRHECVALSLTTGDDGFEVVDSNGNEHYVPAKKIPIVRRDGNAWNLVPLKEGATVTTVEQIPAEAPPEVA